MSSTYSSEEQFNTTIQDRPRVKVCKYCNTDLTEDFALQLTTDAILNNDEIHVTCPKCSRDNTFSAL